MADKFITLHPNNNNTIDPTVNIYPNIKASQNILNDDGTKLTVQEKLESGTNIKTLKVGSTLSEAQSLLGAGSLIIDFLNNLYPVGTIYTCSTKANITNDLAGNPICPIQAILGGVWLPIYDKFLFAAAKGTHSETGDFYPGDTGGSKDAIVPYHTHGGGMTGWAGSHYHGTISTINLDNSDTKVLTGSFSARSANTEPIIGAGTVIGAGTDNMIRCIENGTSAMYNDTGALGGGRSTGDVITIDARHRHVTDNGTPENHRHEIPYTGTAGNATNANMPPYLAVYAWERIS